MSEAEGAGRRWAVLRLLVFAGVVVSAAVTAAQFGPSSTQDWRALVAGHWWGPLLFVALAVVLVVLAVPGTIATVAAGVLYGPVAGAVLAVVSASIGATSAFWIGRRFGRAAVLALVGPRGAAIDARLAAAGWRGLLVLRLIPLVPFNALNYAAGLSSLSTPAYVVGTVLGILPGTVALTVLSSSAHDPTSPAFLVSAGAVVSLVVVSSILGRRARRMAPS